MPATHQVRNQPPDRAPYDPWSEDVALQEGLAREGAEWAAPDLRALGVLTGDPDWLERGRAANENPPELRTHDRHGHRLDAVRYHPAYHDLLGAGITHGLAAAPWRDDAPAGAHVARAAKYILWPQLDSGTLCPMTMTYAVVPSLATQPDLAAEWLPRATTSVYDPAFRPAHEKAGATFGMAMTEKQGGSDVRANATRARPLEDGTPGTSFRLTGHKWFCSAPMSDAFLALARITEDEDDDTPPSCFLIPRWLPDGRRNAFALQRLKDKLGDRSNASSEVEFDDTVGWLVGEPDKGVRTIMQMVAHTRLDCVVGAAGWMRHGLAEAAHHTAHRHAFGARLAEQPLMRGVLADLALESEAATAVALRLARAFERASTDPHEAGVQRIATPAAKYWVCKRAPMHAAEALECLGGNGYVEESPMPRLYRQSPLNGIWEGSGNVQALDLLRAIVRHPEAVEAVDEELDAAAGADARLDAAVGTLRKQLAEPVEARARQLAERLAVCLQGALLVRHGAPAVADAFCATRLAETPPGAFGTLPSEADTDAILARAHPALA
ncbi:isovaleryl-CoA dehydrogenase [Egibacter rhizosphaerae]|uniref:Isovaleryl-CoA dehydrogenase n=1 Tax=Egibacter rhizosphaerae TaxID=1670831 RepID=A0A411YDD7_9ACTN|nr:isovaleryl-CoA dehydrogenase [Egibacter rhizosphaerae]QBI19231.1 isovaleryl-CoA dehydrogenase [Egibacter rhizosphaerae]